MARSKLRETLKKYQISGDSVLMRWVKKLEEIERAKYDYSTDIQPFKPYMKKKISR